MKHFVSMFSHPLRKGNPYSSKSWCDYLKHFKDQNMVFNKKLLLLSLVTKVESSATSRFSITSAVLQFQAETHI